LHESAENRLAKCSGVCSGNKREQFELCFVVDVEFGVRIETDG